MKRTITVEGLGTVTYQESFWTGKNAIVVNGEPAQKYSKKMFEYYPNPNSQEKINFYLQGNFLRGVDLEVMNKHYQIVEKPTWYEVLFTILNLAVPLVWGNIPALVAIFPVVGGALGGAIGGMIAILGLVFSKGQKKFWQKLLILLGFFVFNVAIGFLMAMLIALALL